VPHIDAYQDLGQFPPRWDITIFTTKPDDGGHHPSTHALMCPRELYFDRHVEAIPERVTVAQQRAFDTGHFWHGYLGAMLVDMGFVRPENVERKYRKPLDFGAFGSGTLDFVDVEVPGHGTLPLVDVKTMNAADFEKGRPRADLWRKYVAQVNLYADWIGAPEDYSPILLAVQKDSPHGLLEIEVPRDPALVAEIHDRWEGVALCAKHGVEPPCECGKCRR